MPFSLNLTPEEREAFRAYAMLHQISMGEALKQALWEKIEDEYDIALADDALREFEESGEAARPIEELFEEVGL